MPLDLALASGFLAELAALAAQQRHPKHDLETIDAVRDALSKVVALPRERQHKALFDVRTNMAAPSLTWIRDWAHDGTPAEVPFKALRDLIDAELRALRD